MVRSAIWCMYIKLSSKKIFQLSHNGQVESSSAERDGSGRDEWRGEGDHSSASTAAPLSGMLHSHSQQSQAQMEVPR